jgi:hypothetical protein
MCTTAVVSVTGAGHACAWACLQSQVVAVSGKDLVCEDPLMGCCCVMCTHVMLQLVCTQGLGLSQLCSGSTQVAFAMFCVVSLVPYQHSVGVRGSVWNTCCQLVCDRWGTPLCNGVHMPGAVPWCVLASGLRNPLAGFLLYAYSSSGCAKDVCYDPYAWCRCRDRTDVTDYLRHSWPYLTKSGCGDMQM